MAESKICSISDCGKPHYRNGLCNMHRLRQKRHGDATVTVRRTSSNNCGKKECPAAKKVWNHIHYLNNEQAYKARAANWHEANKDNFKKKSREYRSREDVMQRARERAREWRIKNIERKKQSDREYAEKNRPAVRAVKAKRRASMRNATPAWLTKEQKAEIRMKYEEAERLTQETGLPHDVDHIVPIAGKVVCGLHVPWNLRAIPRIMNNRRPRIYEGDDVMFAGIKISDLSCEGVENSTAKAKVRERLKSLESLASKPCSIERCGKPQFGRGWCSMHYQRWKFHGDANYESPKADKPLACTVEGCEKPYLQKGYCRPHYMRWYKHGDPLAGNAAHKFRGLGKEGNKEYKRLYYQANKERILAKAKARNLNACRKDVEDDNETS